MLINYSYAVAPEGYQCGSCGQSGSRLWREYQTFEPKLFCKRCAEQNQRQWQTESRSRAEDKIGNLVPAVPDEEGVGYWGYFSIPSAGYSWWKRLPEDLS